MEGGTGGGGEEGGGGTPPEGCKKKRKKSKRFSVIAGNWLGDLGGGWGERRSQEAS